MKLATLKDGSRDEVPTVASCHLSMAVLAKTKVAKINSQLRYAGNGQLVLFATQDFNGGHRTAPWTLQARARTALGRSAWFRAQAE